MRVRVASVLGVLAVATAVVASERGAATATVGGKQVAIDYGRPVLKGRPLGDLLKQLPDDRIWRAGDDEVTTLTTDTDITINGKKIPKGKYSLYVYLPEDGGRSLVVNKDLGQPLKNIFKAAPPERADHPWPHLEGYEKSIAKLEVARIPLKKETGAETKDVFTIGLAPAKDGATLNMAWGDESWSADVKAAK